MKRFVALIASSIGAIGGYSSNVQVFAAVADSETDENMGDCGRCLCLCIFHWCLWMRLRLRQQTQREAVTGKAPVNQFIHSVELANAQFRNVVTLMWIRFIHRYGMI